MGTRSQTKVIQQFTPYNSDEKIEKIICSMYRQFDGYLSGHGQDLADFLDDTPLVNGLSGDGNCFNGAGCLAAQMVEHFKEGAGGIYLEHIDNEGQGHDYQIICDEDKMEIRVRVNI